MTKRNWLSDERPVNSFRVLILLTKFCWLLVGDIHNFKLHCDLIKQSTSIAPWITRAGKEVWWTTSSLRVQWEKERITRERQIPATTHCVHGPAQSPMAPLYPYRSSAGNCTAISGVSDHFSFSQFYFNSKATWIMHCTHFFCGPTDHFIALLALWINFLSELLK